MTVSDLISDQLTVVRNAIMAKKKTVIIKRSGVLEGIMSIIQKEGFINNYAEIEDNKQNMIKVYLKYDEEERPVMQHLEKVSTPGLRRYTSCEDIKSVLGGVGIVILSTSKGLMTGREAKKQGIGGEIVCKVY